MHDTFIDLHTHTNRSDGRLTPRQLVSAARAAGIRILAITDHNVLQDDLDDLRKEFPDMQLIDGCEISCRESWVPTEIHVVGLDFDPEHKAIRRILRNNQLDRSPRIEAILQRLNRECGLEMGTYEDLRAEHPETEFLGRNHIARKMVRLGYVRSVDEAFDIYIGEFGQRLAFVEKNLEYISLEEAVGAILEAGGIAVLAHPLYYRLPEPVLERLVAKFSALGGQAMEVYYAGYDEEQQVYLAVMAERNGLQPSAGSDYHGNKSRDTLEQHYSCELCGNLLAQMKS